MAPASTVSQVFRQKTGGCDTSREQILDYLDHLGQPFVTDSTNLEDEYLRNKIRLNLLPMLEELNPSIRETLSDTISHLEGVANVYHLRQEGALKQIVRRESANRMNADIGYLLADPYPQALLYEWLYPLGFNPSQISDICNSLYIDQPGKRFFSKEWEVLRDRRFLMVRRLSGTSKEPELEIKVVEITPSFQCGCRQDNAAVYRPQVETRRFVRALRHAGQTERVQVHDRPQVLTLSEGQPIPPYQRRQGGVADRGAD